MKKEIKKLQRIRDYFRQALGNPEVKDKTKADEARKRVEQVTQTLIFLHLELILSSQLFINILFIQESLLQTLYTLNLNYQ